MNVISATITVTSAGTAERAEQKGDVIVALLKARLGNTGNVYVGGDDVSSTDGFELVPGEAVRMVFGRAINMSSLWADAASSGDQVDVIGETR